QKWLWSNRQEQQGHRVCCLISAEGQLDVQLLSDAVQAVVQQHEILRTTYHHMPGMKIPVQCIAETVTYVQQSIDLRECGPREQEEDVDRLFQQEIGAASPHEQEAPLHLKIIVCSASRHFLLMSLPALSADSKTFTNLV